MKEFKPKYKPIYILIIAIIVFVVGLFQPYSQIFILMGIFVAIMLMILALLLFKYKIVIGVDFFAVNYRTIDQEKNDFNIYIEKGQIFYKFNFNNIKTINININKHPYNIDVVSINDIKFNFSIDYFDKKVKLKIIDEFKLIKKYIEIA